MGKKEAFALKKEIKQAEFDVKLVAWETYKNFKKAHGLTAW